MYLAGSHEDKKERAGGIRRTQEKTNERRAANESCNAYFRSLISSPTAGSLSISPSLSSCGGETKERVTGKKGTQRACKDMQKGALPRALPHPHSPDQARQDVRQTRGWPCRPAG